MAELNSPNTLISSDRVEGTTVYNTVGEKLGSIDHVMIEKTTGQVRYAVLEFGGFLGIGTERYPLPWNVLTYSTDLDGYVVPLDQAQLEKAPRYDTAAAAPEYNEEYARTVYRHYGTEW